MQGGLAVDQPRSLPKAHRTLANLRDWDRILAQITFLQSKPRGNLEALTFRPQTLGTGHVVAVTA
jgi:hypothetical protein